MIFLLLALLLGSPSDGARATPTPGEVWARLKLPNPSGRPECFRFTEGQINGFLEDAAIERHRLGIKRVRLDLEDRGSVRLIVTVRMEEVDLGGRLIPVSRSLLSGNQVFEIQAKLITQAGKARFEVKEARFNSIPLPSWLATSLVSYLARLRPPYWDPTEDFALPYGIAAVTITPGHLEIIR
jgi:hypothetical protein